MRLSGFFGHGLLTALLVLAIQPVLAAQDELTSRGEAILSEHCARCHAIGTEGDSPNAEAPPFRVLSENYPVEDLAESLAEGIMSGHPDMPVFVFTPHDVNAIIAYLQSIQVTPEVAPPLPGRSDPPDARG